MDKTEKIAAYANAYVEDYGFESAMVKARQRMVVEILERERPSTVLEIGCGTDMLHAHAVRAGLSFAKWLTVEPAERFFECARSYAATVQGVEVIRGFFEESVGPISEALEDGPDLILLSGNLHEVPNPKALLGAARKLLSPQGLVHVSVPSAHSFHRRLALEMGLIDALDSPSDRQRALGQPVVYDPAGLRALVTEAGFEITKFGGYLIKPFTHAQMESVSEVVSDEMLDGLWRMGREFPELASEIYVNAR